MAAERQRSALDLHGALPAEPGQFYPIPGAGAHGRPAARPGRLDSAITTPAGIADPAAAVRALELAATQVEKLHGALDVAWGDVMRLRYAAKDLPGNGAPGDPFGVFRTADYAPAPDG